MNKVTELPDGQELVELWEKTKRQEAVINEMDEQLYEKILNETYEVEMHSADVYKEILDKSSEKVKILVKKRTALKRSKGHFFILFAIIAVCFLAIKFLVLRNGEIEAFINTVLFESRFSGDGRFITQVTYSAIVIVSLILSGIINALNKSSVKRALRAINSDEDIKTFDKEVEDSDSLIESKKKYIENEKYKAEMENIENLRKENNYKQIREKMLKYQYGECAFFYFKEFSPGSHYDIKVDGIDTLYSKYEQFQRLGLNPGYHTVEVQLTTNRDDTDYWGKFRFQKNDKELPYFVVCEKVNGMNGYCKEVSFEEFERISRRKLL